MKSPQEVLEFWLGKDPKAPLQNASLWWKKDAEFDREIQRRFEAPLQSAVHGELNAWRDNAEGCLAYIILLDQFSRNIYRDTPQSFAQDPLALAASLAGQTRGLDTELPPVSRVFFYMPMMHSEDSKVQVRSLEMFRGLAETAPKDLQEVLEGNYRYAVAHAHIVERFGRFPHRNKILGRVSTPEEMEFLKQPGSSF